MINDWLLQHIEPINQGKIKVFREDESHLQGGDICGYGWGDHKERLDVKVKNYRDEKTYSGAVNFLTGEMFLGPYSTANTSSTIELIRYLQTQHPDFFDCHDLGWSKSSSFPRVS